VLCHSPLSYFVTTTEQLANRICWPFNNKKIKLDYLTLFY
jgi:hypothetical protein